MGLGHSSTYRGRLAPSPTGYLHLGHARTFWTAQERARAAGGTLILRNDDLDRDRVRPEFVTGFLEDLRWFGCEWSEGPDLGGPLAPYSQSERLPRYRQAFEKLRTGGFIYPCTCSRKDILSALTAPHAADDEPMYPGTCRRRGDEAHILAPEVSVALSEMDDVRPHPNPLPRREGMAHPSPTTSQAGPTRTAAGPAESETEPCGDVGRNHLPPLPEGEGRGEGEPVDEPNRRADSPLAPIPHSALRIPPSGEVSLLTSAPTGRIPSWRFRVPDGEVIEFVDGHFGPQRFVAGRDFGDFVVWRHDGLPSYQLACVVDDAAMQITEVVRGTDLLVSTARQLLLFRALGLKPPAFYHCPLVTDEQGVRLAKRHAALSLRALREAGKKPEELRSKYD